MAQERSQDEPWKRKGEMPIREAAEQEQRLASQAVHSTSSGGPGGAGGGSSQELCRNLMKTRVVTAAESDSIQHAAELMRDTGVGFLPVCRADGRAIGTITDRDITIRVSAENRDAETCRVAEVMTHEVIACRPYDPIEQAERLMSRHRKSRMMVTDDEGRLTGVISLSDIATHESHDRTGETLQHVVSREAQT